MQALRFCEVHSYKHCFKSIALLLLVFGVIIAAYTYVQKDSFTQAPKRIAHFSLKAKHGSSIQSPHQHVYYLKTHKTGSSTMCSIFVDFIRSHNLLPLLPRRSININQNGIFKEKQLGFIDGVDKYDVVFNHHVFTQEIFKYLHDDTFKVTSLREPFDNFISAFDYYRNEWRISYLLKVRGDDPVNEFLRNPQRYETQGFKSWTNNRQSMDLGFDLSHGFDDIQYIRHFIDVKDREFDLVLIMEYFDEGLIMMKRILGWNTQDILYFSKNKGRHSETRTGGKSMSDIQQRQLHARFSQADVMLYDHFLNVFKDKMFREVGFKEEVAEFKKILRKLWDFCDALGQSNNELIIPAGKWNNEFTISRDKCSWRGFECDQLTNILQRDYLKEQ